MCFALCCIVIDCNILEAFFLYHLVIKNNNNWGMLDYLVTKVFFDLYVQ